MNDTHHTSSTKWHPDIPAAAKAELDPILTKFDRWCRRWGATGYIATSGSIQGLCDQLLEVAIAMARHGKPPWELDDPEDLDDTQVPW